ncbi:hypothetical protein JW707_00640 [Candidatus Woesearchaeota archaeon]|nr:hypothetical protein [Candidatus Woesearchaeota archaeon]
MINNDLVGYIQNYIQQGYSKQQIVDFLKQYNYNPQDISDTFDFVQRSASAEQKIQEGIYPEAQPAQPQAQPQQPQQPMQTAPQKPAEKAQYPGKKKIIIIAAAAAAVILVIAVLAFWIFTRPVCGNGIVEKGETAETCCEDTGCIGDQTCGGDHACAEPVCGECQYLQNHACADYGCCADEDCATDRECMNHECVPVQCEFCQYAENHSCFDFECCSEADCLPGLVCDENVCVEECGYCQYRVSGVCIEHECCNSTACANDEKCENNFCIPLACPSGQAALNHSCVELEGCTSNSDCDDGNNNTLDLCLGAGTVSAHCTHMEADQCDDDNDCDDGNITTDDVCSGSPKACSHTLTDCSEIGDDCPPSYGSCDGDLYEVLDTDYCCAGTCIEGPDLYIESMDKKSSQLEVEIGGADTVNETKTFKIYAFENGTRMNTETGLQYFTLNGQNTTTVFYFNFTLSNITINATAAVDYDSQINETNETNNNMTISVALS